MRLTKLGWKLRSPLNPGDGGEQKNKAKEPGSGKAPPPRTPLSPEAAKEASRRRRTGCRPAKQAARRPDRRQSPNYFPPLSQAGAGKRGSLPPPRLTFVCQAPDWPRPRASGATEGRHNPQLLLVQLHQRSFPRAAALQLRSPQPQPGSPSPATRAGSPPELAFRPASSASALPTRSAPEGPKRRPPTRPLSPPLPPVTLAKLLVRPLPACLPRPSASPQAWRWLPSFPCRLCPPRLSRSIPSPRAGCCC